MKVVYPNALVAFMTKLLDLSADTIKIQPVDADYTYSAAHDFLDDVPAGARIGTAATLGSKTIGTVAAGVFDAANATITAPAAGDTVTGYVIYADIGGSDATRRLLVYVNEDDAGAAISVATNGTDLLITFPATGVFKI